MTAWSPDGPLDELAGFLCAPVRSGIYLTRSDLFALARVADGSLRVGERRRMLADVLRSAQSGEELANLVERVAGFCRACGEEYHRLVAEAPASGPALAPWIERVERTISRLDRVCAEIRLGARPEG